MTQFPAVLAALLALSIAVPAAAQSGDVIPPPASSPAEAPVKVELPDRRRTEGIVLSTIPVAQELQALQTKPSRRGGSRPSLKLILVGGAVLAVIVVGTLIKQTAD